MKADAIPHRPDVRQIRLISRIGLHAAFEKLQLRIRTGQAVGIAADADGHEHDIGLDDAGLGAGQGQFHAARRRFQFVGLGFHAHVDLALGEDTLQEDRHIVVLVGQKMIEHLDDDHFRSDGVVKIGEFAADRAGADDRQSFGLSGQIHRLAGGDDFLAVKCDARQRRRLGAGGDDDVLGRHFATRLARR